MPVVAVVVIMGLEILQELEDLVGVETVAMDLVVRALLEPTQPVVVAVVVVIIQIIGVAVTVVPVS
tara:strand:- start:987 stop:1184 length:198 start_codon:yes stop_codon:yes gene_type:complete